MQLWFAISESVAEKKLEKKKPTRDTNAPSAPNVALLHPLSCASLWGERWALQGQGSNCLDKPTPFIPQN